MLRSHLTYANVTATLALFFALAGGSAYAINEWNSSNIQNETLLSEDIKNGTLKAEDYGVGSVSGARIQDNNVTTLDLADGAIFGNDVRDESLTSADIQNFSLGNGDFLDGSVDSRVATDNSLTGADIAADSVHSADIGSVTGGDILDSTVFGTDINANTLTGADILESTLVGVNDGDSCPGAATLYGPLCVLANSTPRTFFDAANLCASFTAQYRLPTWGEAINLAVNHDIPGVSTTEGFWTDEVTSDPSGSNLFLMAVDENGNGGAHEASGASDQAVCVTTPD